MDISYKEIARKVYALMPEGDQGVVKYGMIPACWLDYAVGTYYNAELTLVSADEFRSKIAIALVSLSDRHCVEA